MILFYRKDLYDKSGLEYPDKEKGLSLDQFINNCRTLNSPQDELYGTALAGMKGSQQWSRIESFAVSLGGDPVLDKNLKPALTAQPWRRALEVYKDLLESACPPGVWEYSFAEQNTAFAQGLVAHMLQYMVAITSVEDPEASKVAGKVGYNVYPGGGKSAGGCWHLSINAYSQYPDETWEFLNFVNNKENAATQALLFTNDIIRKSTFTDPRFVEKFPEASSMSKGLEGTFYRLPGFLPQTAEISTVMIDELNAAVVGLKEINTALETAQEKIEKILGL